MFTNISPRALIGCGVLILTLAGCTTLDPTEDIARAERILAERTGHTPEWSATDREAPALPPLGETLTLEAAIERALRVHPSLERDLAQIAAARADLVSNDRLPNPMLSFGIGTVIDGGGGAPLRGGLLAPLTALFSRPARVAAAEASLRAQVFTLADDALRTIEEVTLACAEVHYGRTRVSLDTRAIECLAERARLIETVVAAGEASRSAADSARVDLARAHDRLSQSRTTLAIAERQLLEQLGTIDRVIPCPEIAAETLPRGSDPTIELPKEHALIGMVALRRLDVAAAIARAEGFGAKLRVARRERFGAIGGTVGLERNFTGREAVTTGLSLEIPIFDFGGAEVARADAQQRAEIHAAEVALWHAYLEARSNHAQLIGARERLESLTERWLPAARGKARVLRETAEVGEASRSDALLAESQAIDAERVFNDATLAATRALATLLRSAGGSLAPLSVEEADRLDLTHPLSLAESIAGLEGGTP